MFGLGKQKVHLGQASRLITTALLNYPEQDYSNIEEIKTNFSEDQIQIISDELNLFRYMALSFAFATLALEKRYKINAEDLGQIVSYAMRLAFEDFGYEGDSLENVMNKFISDTENITSDLEKLDKVNRHLIETTIARSFTSSLLTTIEVSKNDNKRTAIMFHSTAIIVGINNLLSEFLKQYRIIEFK